MRGDVPGAAYCERTVTSQRMHQWTIRSLAPAWEKVQRLDGCRRQVTTAVPAAGPGVQDIVCPPREGSLRQRRWRRPEPER